MNLSDFIAGDKRLYDIDYVDEARLTHYAQQIDAKGPGIRIGRLSFGVNVAVARIGAEARPDETDGSIPATIRRVVAHLAATGALAEEPRRHKDEGAVPFHYFYGRAVRYVLPADILSLVGYDGDVILWLLTEAFDAPKAGLSAIRGNVVFLIQRRDTEAGYFAGGSAYSAAQELMKELGVIAGEGDPRAIQSFDDMRSPAAMLEDLGARRSASRRIVTCYRPRAMSDNMYMMVDGERRRFNDMVAYPLFILSL